MYFVLLSVLGQCHDPLAERIHNESVVEERRVIALNTTLPMGKTWIVHAMHVGMVLSIAATGRYVVNIGLIPAGSNNRSSTDWYTLDSQEIEGFICIGQSQAIFEIIAWETDISLIIAGAYLDKEKAEIKYQCTEVWAASSTPYYFPMMEKGEAPCFFTTDFSTWLSYSASFSPSKNVAAYAIRDNRADITAYRKIQEIYQGNKGIQIMTLRASDTVTSINVSLIYSGGSLSHEYTSSEPVSYASHAEFFGLYNNGMKPLEPLSSDFEYPNLDNEGGTPVGVIVGVLVPILVVILVASVCIKRKLGKKERSSSEEVIQEPEYVPNEANFPSVSPLPSGPPQVYQAAYPLPGYSPYVAPPGYAQPPPPNGY